MNTTPPVETKVKASTAGAYLGSLAGLEVIEAVQDNPLLIAPLPDWLEPIILSLLPALVTFLAGYRARHTPRGPVSGV